MLSGDTVSSTGTKVMVVFQDSHDAMWFGGSENGVYKFDGKSLVRFTMKHGLCSNSVLGIQEDRSGNLYFDTQEGVCKFDGRKFTTLEVIGTAPNAWKLGPDDLWFRMGWDNKRGPYRYDGEHLYHLEFPKTAQADTFHAQYPQAAFDPYGIYTMYKDHKGNMWFGTAALGACRFDGTSISWLYENQLTDTPEGGSFGIRSILEDEDGMFWFCNTRYQYSIQPTSSMVNGTNLVDYSRKSGVGATSEKTEFPYFLSMTEDDNGDMWMVTYDDGVWRSDGESLTRFPLEEGDTKALLFCIYKDHQGGLWVGTQNAGLYRLNGTAFVPFTP
ncbi:MAG: hypothetical protein IPO60_04455 [Flavobacteriales bacterium]|nr:hypothetical protein [Flavobacteriales bacterium]MBK6892414.1 hypothetical protein [Flavobacteriales bacterium]MBK7246552.1 hypothetical protein [Flavobacteriales bacterium]MBK7288396.1 hypothetical protein [Flavobacteriales bacterium]MBK9060731.1 hypothetical protein [Flavobacteriales bacterium]